MRQFLAAVKGEAGTGGIAQDISDAVSRIRDHPQWSKEYMLFELKMRDAKQEGREEGRAEGQAEGLAKGLKQGRAEERKEIAAVMIRGNEPDEKIVRYSGLSLKEVQELRAGMS